MSTEARVIDLCNAIVAKLAALAPESTVIERAYCPSYDGRTMTGRHIWVLPGPESENQYTRGQKEMGPRVAVTVAYKFDDVPASTDTEPVPPVKVDEQIKWVQDHVWDVLRDERIRFGVDFPLDAYPWAADMETLYDDAELIENKVLYSEMVFEFRVPV